MSDQELIENLRFMLGGMDSLGYEGSARIVEAAADRLAELTTLRPMEDAPRDGTRFLALVKSSHMPNPEVVIQQYTRHGWRYHKAFYQHFGWLPLPTVSPTPSEVQG
jgi:hypothetical protein